MFLPIELTPEEITPHCNLHENMHNTKMFMCISKGICGLKESGSLSDQQLYQHLVPYENTSSKHSVGL